MQEYRCRGTITVFLSILSVLFLSLACTLVESARVQGARAKAAVVTDLGLFSVFGEYERGLLEDYDVFFLDGSYGTGTFQKELAEERFQKYLEENLSAGESWYLKGFQMFPMQLSDCEVENYALMTDDNGAVFYQQVVKNVKETLGTEMVSRYLESRNEVEKQEKAGEEYQNSESNNQAELTRIEQEAKEAEEAAAQDGVVVIPDEGEEIQAPAVKVNPLDVIKKVKKMGILGLVLKDESQVSTKAVEKAQLPTGRTLNKGNLEMKKAETGLTAETIFQDYLVTHFPCKTSEEREGALEYQVEYLLGGKSSDRENLKYVVNKLLLMREGANFVCAAADASMRRQAEVLAMSLAGATGIAALVPVVTTALLLAWAYGESLLDVRLLLAGGKVEVVKTAANWKLSLQNLGRILEVLTECDQGGGQGLGYEEYLRLLLAGGSQEKYPMRALDLIEANLRLKEGTENFRSDNCVAKVRATADWELPMVFLRVPQAFLGKSAEGRQLQVRGTFGY
ncbi:MAG: DUF5702 domain-containing protein [Eubacteriales bacterium]|nr:DUF5702 domain-containing protein [Eubacteriales bacterium]